MLRKDRIDALEYGRAFVHEILKTTPLPEDPTRKTSSGMFQNQVSTVWTTTEDHVDLCLKVAKWLYKDHTEEDGYVETPSQVQQSGVQVMDISSFINSMFQEEEGGND